MALADHSETFDCLECGRHIVRIVPMPQLPKLCAMCITNPGWFRIPEIRRLIDPDMRDEDIPEHERYAAET